MYFKCESDITRFSFQAANSVFSSLRHQRISRHLYCPPGMEQIIERRWEIELKGCVMASKAKKKIKSHLLGLSSNRSSSALGRSTVWCILKIQNQFTFRCMVFSNNKSFRMINTLHYTMASKLKKQSMKYMQEIWVFPLLTLINHHHCTSFFNLNSSKGFVCVWVFWYGFK